MYQFSRNCKRLDGVWNACSTECTIMCANKTQYFVLRFFLVLFLNLKKIKSHNPLIEYIWQKCLGKKSILYTINIEQTLSSNRSNKAVVLSKYLNFMESGIAWMYIEMPSKICVTDTHHLILSSLSEYAEGFLTWQILQYISFRILTTETGLKGTLICPSPKSGEKCFTFC